MQGPDIQQEMYGLSRFCRLGFDHMVEGFRGNKGVNPSAALRATGLLVLRMDLGDPAHEIMSVPLRGNMFVR